MSELLKQIQQDHAAIHQNMIGLLRKVVDGRSLAAMKANESATAELEAVITVANSAIANLATIAIALVKISDALDRIHADHRQIYGGAVEVGGSAVGDVEKAK